MNIIKGYNPPDTTTPGNVGDYYIDRLTNLMYKCIAIDSAERSLGFVIVDDYTLDSTVYVWDLCNVVKNQDKSVTNNGEYTADEGYTGLGLFSVDNVSPHSAFGSANTYTAITNSYSELTSSSLDNGRYMQIRVYNIEASNSDKYDYWFEPTANLSLLVDTDQSTTYTIKLPAVKYTVSSERETNTTVTLIITVADNIVTAKSSSSSYYFKLTCRMVTPTAAIF